MQIIFSGAATGGSHTQASAASQRPSHSWGSPYSGTLWQIESRRDLPGKDQSGETSTALASSPQLAGRALASSVRSSTLSPSTIPRCGCPSFNRLPNFMDALPRLNDHLVILAPQFSVMI